MLGTHFLFFFFFNFHWSSLSIQLLLEWFLIPQISVPIVLCYGKASTCKILKDTFLSLHPFTPPQFLQKNNNKGVQISFWNSWKRVGTVSLTNDIGGSWRKSSTASTKQWAVFSGGFHCLCTRIKWWTTCQVTVCASVNKPKL